MRLFNLTGQDITFYINNAQKVLKSDGWIDMKIDHIDYINGIPTKAYDTNYNCIDKNNNNKELDDDDWKLYMNQSIIVSEQLATSINNSILLDWGITVYFVPNIPDNKVIVDSVFHGYKYLQQV